MSVDDAFRKIMENEPGATPPPGPHMGEEMSSGMPHPPPAQSQSSDAYDDAASASQIAAVMAPPSQVGIPHAEAMQYSPPAPEPSVPFRPDVPKLDLSKVRRLDRLSYHPVDNRSQIAEEYRILRTRLQALELKHPSILLTSCHHNEGKTSTAMNLSLAMARKRDAKILLIDFDLRRPRLHKMLGLPKMKSDVVSVLRDKCDPEDAIFYSVEDNLHILSARREYSNGTDFLETPQAKSLIDRVHATFDFVVMDSCPCLSTSDPAILGPFVGGIIMIIRCLQTQRESIEYAINSLSQLGLETSGVVLTYMKYFIPRYLYRYQYYHGYYYYRGYSYGSDEVRGDPAPEDESAA